MKKSGLFFLVSFLLLFTACDNEIDLTAEWKDIPIVYGLLDVQDTAHYIRVEKAFLDPETSALEIAQRADSLYYDEADVFLVDMQTEESYQLYRVNGNEDGYRRDTGLFAHDPNYLYKIRADEVDIRSGRTYGFELYRGEEQEVVTSETVVLDTMEFLFLDPGDRLSFQPEDRTTSFRWRENEHAAFYSFSVRINFRERSPDTGGEFVDKSVTWNIQPRTENDRVEVLGEEFYSFLSNGLESDPQIERSFRSIDLLLDAGGEALDEYIQVSLANIGVTGSQEIPNFSNLSEGYGVFSSITKKRLNGLDLTERSLDSLQMGSKTVDLNF